MGKFYFFSEKNITLKVEVLSLSKYYKINFYDDTFYNLHWPRAENILWDSHTSFCTSLNIFASSLLRKSGIVKCEFNIFCMFGC